ncbi:hypothetical protein K0C01_08790 [Salinarchaeum sp. IM2453]|uniref:coiled-coil domain-containing protein n=1 Tax=Salinarchaeum sp. IM2453 TaxID=2862870 RepID=UPI001C838B60|nr:hypothetical protein [Salinarchaeum sp. IM2453]QZA87891.1 hypothetical protein K0C01_08790 [Salinarchaeum sp. IM2453]
MSDLVSRVDSLESQVIKLSDQLEAKDAQINSLKDEIAELKEANEELREENDELRDELEETNEEVDELNSTIIDLESKQEGWVTEWIDQYRDMLCELHSKELQKGSKLRKDHVMPDLLPDGPDQLKTVKRDGEVFYKAKDLPEAIEEDGPDALPYEDLLPIQKLNRMDEDTFNRTTNSDAEELAAELWASRGNRHSPWKRGCKNVREYVSASDLKMWIIRERSDVSQEYAKKLVSRIIDVMHMLTRNRIQVKKKTRRTDGLTYKERRIIIPDDAEIPGESSPTNTDQSSPGTSVVTG